LAAAAVDPQEEQAFAFPPTSDAVIPCSAPQHELQSSQQFSHPNEHSGQGVAQHDREGLRCSELADWLPVSLLEKKA
jgi:hypothetical protein